jgi:2-methylcitrate dehydratase PrpD
VTGVVHALGAMAVGLRERACGAEAQRWARRAFVDWLGVTLGGAGELPARALWAGLDLDGYGPSRIVGRAERAPAPLAALVNGTAAHTLELDDIYAPGLYHPGAPTIAAALAVADQRDLDLGRLLRAVVVGFEVGCRVAQDLGPTHYAHWHTTGTAGALGAAAAAADAAGADATTVANALSLAATTCGGLQQTFRSDAAGKPLHAGAAAQAGVVAAAAARSGLSGAPDVLEGPAGLAAGTGTTTGWDVSRASPDDVLAVERITVKPYQCCGHAFAAIDAALGLRTAVAGRTIDEVVVETYATAIATAGIAAPESLAERRFSIPHLVAAALSHKRFDPGVVPDGPLLALTRRVRLLPAREFDERFPSRRGARVSVRTGSDLHHVDVPDRSGSPESPLDDERLAGKFVAASGLGERAVALLSALRRADPATRLRDLDLGACAGR